MKNILLTILALGLPLMAAADSYTALWKQVKEAQKKDLPKTELKVLRQISAKAEREKAYGQLLKAQLLTAVEQTAVSPDSAEAEITRLENREQKTNDKVMKAVYSSVLGKLYAEKSATKDDEASQKSRQWYKASLTDMPLLASHKSAEYEPALVKGIDSRIFYDDLLHALGMEAGEYEKLRSYYEKNGNRPAACICAFEALRKTKPEYIGKAKKSRYLQQVDSLVKVYADLREAGELAVEHYNVIAGAEDESAEEKVSFINYALSRWGEWPRMNVLRNALNDLQQPSYAINVGDYMLLPNVERTIRINGLRNIDELYVNVYKVNADGNSDIDPSTTKGYNRMRHLIVPGSVFTATKKYIGQAPWKELSDTLNIKGLPIGVYLIETTTSNANIQPQRELLRVSNIYVMHQSLPDNKIRIAVVNATTGRAVSGAHVVVMTKVGDNKTGSTLTTDHNGEAEYSYANSRKRPSYIYAYTDDDRACGKFGINSNYYFWNNGQKMAHRVQAFTDRSVYRPGQTVHASSVSWTAEKTTLSSKAEPGRQVKFTLRNANGRTVAEKTATTDSFGSAANDFTLPSTGLTGQYSLQVNDGQSSASTWFRVEQYKRPTFQVSFDNYKEAYKDGDTISVRGVATTYSGVPVQGAKVKYTIKRRDGLWWFRHGQSMEIENDSLVTASDGSFLVRVPMNYPEDIRLSSRVFFNFDVDAQVTDGAGETREGQISLPLSNRPAILSVDLPDKLLRDSLKTITFTCKNLTGENVDSKVVYRLDGGEWKTTITQHATPVTTKLTSGLHRLEAICEGDTLKQEAVLFSLGDRHPATVTHDWFYLSASQFPDNGQPVYIQAGSSDEDTQVYYTVFSGNKIIVRGTKHISNEVETRKLQYKQSYGDGLTITLAWVVRGKLYQHTAQIQRPQPDTQLKLSWKTFRDKLKPGQKEQWTMSIALPDGKPAKAQLLAAMYDKSLDAIASPNKWSINNSFYFSLPNSRWSGGSNSAIGLYGFQPYASLRERDLRFTHFDTDMFGWNWPLRTHNELYLGRGVRMYKHAQVMNMAMAAPEAIGAMSTKSANDINAREALSDMAVSADVAESGVNGNHNPQSSTLNPQTVRENLTETAFFYPSLLTDDEGNVNISFTLPESVTTWRFLGLAHDTLMNNGTVTAEAIASKTIMVQPNMPRFLREGDKGSISTRIFNTTDKRQSGVVRLVIADPETDFTIYEKRYTFAVQPNGTVTSTFKVDASQLAEKANGQTLVVAKVYAEGNGFSDGEQHYLPLLPDMEHVVNTIPFYQNEAGVKEIDLTKIFPSDSKGKKLTVEYTNNPSWLVIQALPSLANPYQEDAASLAAAIYANIIGRQILTSSPKIAQTIKLWQQEAGNETSLTSSLAKNQELKTILLSETPWVADADHETDQKQMLAQYLDESTINYRVNDFTTKLRKLQNSDGSFSWWPGMTGNPYMTVSVVETLVRLNKIAGEQSSTRSLLSNAFTYLKGKIAEEVTELKKEDKKGVKNLQPSELACHYLYSAALDGQKETADMVYLVNLLNQIPAQLSIYGKANTAVILAQYGKTSHAKTLLESIRQYTVYKDETGRYFDTHKAKYSWMDYRIPTQTAAIEALQMLEPSDTVTIQQMQRWLLHEKRTTDWSTSVNTVNAVYSFFNNQSNQINLSNQPQAILRLDGQTLGLPTATAGIGYVKVAKNVNNVRQLTIDKTSTGTSWGAVYGQFLQKATNVNNASSGLSITRQIIVEGNHKAQASNLIPQSLNVGDKVKVRITVTADRDYDFVQIQDKRAACMEPVSQLSGYGWGLGCYIAQQDNVTNYYFDKMSKGTHIIETEYYVDRSGDYISGICTVQCAYSPEFSGREAGQAISVK